MKQLFVALCTVVVLGITIPASAADFPAPGEWAGMWKSPLDKRVSMESTFSSKPSNDDGWKLSYVFEAIPLKEWKSPPGEYTVTIDNQQNVVVTGKLKTGDGPVTFEVKEGAFEDDVLTWRWRGAQSGKAFEYRFVFNKDKTVDGTFFIDGDLTLTVTMTSTSGEQPRQTASAE